MTDSTRLCVIREEFDRLIHEPDTLFKLVNERYEEKCSKLDDQECENEAQKIACDNLRNQLDAQNKSLHAKISHHLHTIEALQAEVSKHKLTIQQNIDEKSKLDASLRASQQHVQQLKNNLEQQNESKLSIAQMTHQKDERIKQLNEQCSSLSEKIRTLMEDKRDLQQNLLDEQTKSIPIEFKYKDLLTKVQSLEEHDKWLTEQLHLKQTQLTQDTHAFRQKINSLESQYNSLKNDHALLQQKFSTAEKSLAQNHQQLTAYLDKINSIKADKDSIESSLQDEVLKQSRVINLYKTTNADLQNKIDKLTADLANAQDRFNHEISQKDRTLQQWIDKCTEANDTIAKLEVDLKKKESDSRHSMTPLQNVTSMLNEGLTSTHVYEKYVQASQDIIKLRSEKESIQKALDDIMRELEAKKPIFHEQKEDYERLMSAYVLQTNKYQLALRENENYKQQIQHLSKHTAQVEQLTAENDNLSAQVSRLLFECIEYKRRLNSGASLSSNAVAQGDNEDTDTSEFDAQAVIAEDLVTFEDVEQLQKNNRQLLNQIQKLKTERDQATKNMENRLNQSYKEKLSTAMAEIEKLRKERQTQLNNFKSIIKQRDMLKSLVTEMEKEKQSSANSSDSAQNDGQNSNQSASSSADAHTTPKELREIQMEYIKSRQMMQQELDEERKSRMEAQSSAQRYQTQFEDAEARIKLKDERIEMINVELVHLREAKDNLIQKLLSVQESLTQTYKRLEDKEEQSNTQKSTISTLQAQLKYTQERTDRLLKEVESFQQYKQAQGNVSAQLRELQSHLETQFLQEKERAAELRDKEKEKALQYKDEVKKLNKKLEDIQHEHFSEKNKLSEELTQFQNQISTLKEERAKLTTENESQTKKIQDLTQQLKESEHRLTMLIHQYTVNEEGVEGNIVDEEQTPTEGATDQTTDSHAVSNRLKISLSAYRQEIEVKDERIRQLKESIEEAQKLSKEKENALQEISETHEKFKNEMQNQLTKSVEEKEKLKKQLQDVQSELAQTTNELLEERQNQQTQQEQHSLEGSSSERNVSASSLKEAEDRISKLKKDLEEEHRLFSDSKRKYEEAVIEHGQAVEKTRKLEQELQKYNQNPQLSHNDKIELEKLRTDQSTWKELEESLRAQIKELSDRVDSEVDQKNNLYSEFEKMTIEIEKLRSQESNTDDESQLNKQIVQLREIIRHLRREKDISQTQFESEEKKSQILQVRYESVKKELEERTAEVQQLKQHERPMQEEEYNTRKQLMRDLSVYQESNATLRSQNEKLQSTCDDLTNQLSSLKTKVQPLQQQLGQKQNQLQAKDQEIAQLRSNTEKWKKRVEGLLKKDVRIDPEEHENLKSSNESLEKEKQTLTQKIQAMETNMEKLQDIKRKCQSFKELSTKYKQQNQKLEEEVKRQKEQLEEAKNASEANQAQNLGITRKQKKELKKLQEDLASANTSLEEERKRFSEELDSEKEKTTTLESKSLKLQAALTKLRKLYSDMKKEKISYEDQVETLNEQLAQLKEKEGAMSSENAAEAEMDTTAEATSEAEKTSGESAEETATQIVTESSAPEEETQMHAGQKRKHDESTVSDEESEPPHKKAKPNPQPSEVEEEETEQPASVEGNDETTPTAAPETPTTTQEETQAEETGEEQEGNEEEDGEESSDEDETPVPTPTIITSKTVEKGSKSRKIQRPRFGPKKDAS